MRNFSINAGEIIGFLEGGWGRFVLLSLRMAKNDVRKKEGMFEACQKDVRFIRGKYCLGMC